MGEFVDLIIEDFLLLDNSIININPQTQDLCNIFVGDVVMLRSASSGLETFCIAMNSDDVPAHSIRANKVFCCKLATKEHYFKLLNRQ
jgi:hypothetical protein